MAALHMLSDEEHCHVHAATTARRFPQPKPQISGLLISTGMSDDERPPFPTQQSAKYTNQLNHRISQKGREKTTTASPASDQATDCYINQPIFGSVILEQQRPPGPLPREGRGTGTGTRYR
jgi:hypothetical protein